jgi:hypothetical protein
MVLLDGAQTDGNLVAMRPKDGVIGLWLVDS